MHQVNTSQELVDMALQNKYAIIITNNSYNDGRDNGGIYAIGEIRKHNKITPILFQSSVITPTIYKIAKEAGATRSIDKTHFGEIQEFLKTYNL